MVVKDRGKTRKVARSFDLYSLPTYVINMKERADRWSRFTGQQTVSAFKRLHRFNAVNGKKLNPQTDKRISVQTRMNILRNYRRSHHEIATLGAIGASLSHIGVWKKFVASGSPMCLIMEDDAILDGATIEQINTLMKTAPKDWDMWILGYWAPNLIVEDLPNSNWNKVYNFTAAHAYILTRSAALRFLEEPTPIESHIEYYMTASAVLKNMLIVQHPDIHINFYHKRTGPRTNDSNTSQHKKHGCPTCNVADDLAQLYVGATRKTDHGINVQGLVRKPQPNVILTMKRGARRKNSRHP